MAGGPGIKEFRCLSFQVSRKERTSRWGSSDSGEMLFCRSNGTARLNGVGPAGLGTVARTAGTFSAAVLTAVHFWTLESSISQIFVLPFVLNDKRSWD